MTTRSTLLAEGTNAAASADVTLEGGDVATLSVTGQGQVQVQFKTVNDYSDQGAIGTTYYWRNGCQLQGPVTFRVYRAESPEPVGCDMEVA